MAESKKPANKAAKTTTATKKAAPKKPAAPKTDLSKLSESNTVEAIVDSKHMKKGNTYSGIGRNTAEGLVKRGLVKLV